MIMNTQPPRNPRELISYVADKLLKQGRKATIHGHICVLVADNGDRCAIGWLGVDSGYDGWLNELWDRLGWCVSTQLLEDVRKIHDNYEPAEWESEFTKLLAQYPEP